MQNTIIIDIGNDKISVFKRINDKTLWKTLIELVKGVSGFSVPTAIV